MPFKDKLKGVFHHKKTPSTSTPTNATPAQAVPPPKMREVPGFRKSFNMSREDESHPIEGASGTATPTSNTSGANDNLRVPSHNRHADPNGGSGMYTVDPYDGDYLSVSPRTRSTIPDDSSNGDNDPLTAVPSLDLRDGPPPPTGTDTLSSVPEDGKATPRHYDHTNEGAVEGAAQKLEKLTTEERDPEYTRAQYAKEEARIEQRGGGRVEPAPTRAKNSISLGSGAFGTGPYVPPAPFRGGNLDPVPQRESLPTTPRSEVATTPLNEIPSDIPENIYNKALLRPGLKDFHRDTDASVYSEDGISGGEPLDRELTRDAYEHQAYDRPDISSPYTNTTHIDDTSKYSVDKIDGKDTNTGNTFDTSTAKNTSIQPQLSPHQQQYTGLFSSAMTEAESPQPQTDTSNHSTRFHQPGDFFSAVRDNFPESATQSGSAVSTEPVTANTIQSSGYLNTPLALKEENASQWSQGVISGVEDVSANTPRKEMAPPIESTAPAIDTSKNPVLVSPMLDQAASEAHREEYPTDGDGFSTRTTYNEIPDTLEVNDRSTTSNILSKSVHPYFGGRSNQTQAPEGTFVASTRENLSTIPKEPGTFNETSHMNTSEARADDSITTANQGANNNLTSIAGSISASLSNAASGAYNSAANLASNDNARYEHSSGIDQPQRDIDQFDTTVASQSETRDNVITPAVDRLSHDNNSHGFNSAYTPSSLSKETQFEKTVQTQTQDTSISGGTERTNTFQNPHSVSAPRFQEVQHGFADAFGNNVTTSTQSTSIRGADNMNNGFMRTGTSSENTGYGSALSSITENKGIVPTISEAASNTYNAATDTLGGNIGFNKPTTAGASFDTGSHLHDNEKQPTSLLEGSTNTTSGVGASVSDTITNAYTAASNALSRATDLGSTSATQQNSDLESGLERRQIDPSYTSSYGAQTQSSTGVVPVITRTINNVYDSVASTITPTGQSTVTGVQTSNGSNTGVIPSITNGAAQLYDQASSAVANTISGSSTASQVTHESRPFEKTTSDYPVMTTKNSIPSAAQLNQSITATPYGKVDLPRDGISQVGGVIKEDNQTNLVHSGSTTEEVRSQSTVTRPQVQSMDTSATINLMRAMPGGFYLESS